MYWALVDVQQFRGATPACLMWCILGERNRCTFDYKESSVPNLKFLL